MEMISHGDDENIFKSDLQLMNQIYRKPIITAYNGCNFDEPILRRYLKKYNV